MYYFFLDLTILLDFPTFISLIVSQKYYKCQYKNQDKKLDISPFLCYNVGK